MKDYKHKRKKTVTKDVKAVSQSAQLLIINPDAAGIDIGSGSHYVAVPENRSDDFVREFSSVTSSIREMAFWLKECNIKTVAMESTGIYWIPVYEILESHGFEVILVNSRHVKNVSGRKTDVLDCQWIQRLHSYGLLANGFRPKEQYLKIRSLSRQFCSLIEHRSPHVLHMQKALFEMNIQLTNKISDLMGFTGQQIVRSIVKGNRDPRLFASMIHPACKQKEDIIKSLEGNYKEEHVFILKQALDLYDYYTKKMMECEKAIEDALNELHSKCSLDTQQLKMLEPEPFKDKMKKSKPLKNEIRINLKAHLVMLAGADISEIEGIGEMTAFKILSEIGFSISAWRTSKHFTSWLGLCPGNKVSGGKRLSSSTRQSKNRVAHALRLAAQTLYRSKCYLGAFFRRMRARMGAPKAITATAHKLAKILYAMLKEGKSFKSLSVAEYEQKFQERKLKNLQRQASELGYKLVNA